LLCFGGSYFGPLAQTNVDTTKEVRIEVLKAAGGHRRVLVSQRQRLHDPIIETWNEKRP
jgi:hypothetical protein